MNEEQIIAKITDIFRLVFEDPTLVISKTLTADDVEKWDSLSHIDMIVMVEEAFGVRLPLREVAKMNNVGELIQSLCIRLLP